jgi:alkylation response protein AidB-like acyl-CoA dehydrogenase
VAAVAVIEELSRAGSFAAGPFIHCAFYGGVNISENGSPEQKRELLPRLARGELLFAYGLSEPDVGGDLASVRTSARRSQDGAHVVVNGTKRWCTGAEFGLHLLPGRSRRRPAPPELLCSCRRISPASRFDPSNT